MKFQVTKDDILKALESGGGTNFCPIALRLQDEFGLDGDDVEVSGTEIRIKNKEYTPNQKIKSFIERYDKAERDIDDFDDVNPEDYILKKVKPISFDLPIKKVTMWDFEVEDEGF